MGSRAPPEHLNKINFKNTNKEFNMKKTNYLSKLTLIAIFASLLSTTAFAGGTESVDPKAAKVLTGYLDGVALLAKDDLPGAISAFKKFKADLTDLKYSWFESDKKTTMMRLVAVTESKTLEELRKVLAPLSESVILLKMKLNLGPAAHYYYCSMTGSFWASASDEIKNPYHGTKYLDCGVRVDSIK